MTYNSVPCHGCVKLVAVGDNLDIGINPWEYIWERYEPWATIYLNDEHVGSYPWADVSGDLGREPLQGFVISNQPEKRIANQLTEPFYPWLRDELDGWNETG